MEHVGVCEEKENKAADALNELYGFLTPATRSDVRDAALKYIEGASLSTSGVELFLLKDDAKGLRLLMTLVQSTSTDAVGVASKASTFRILINTCATSGHVSDALIRSNDTATGLIDWLLSTSSRSNASEQSEPCPASEPQTQPPSSSCATEAEEAAKARLLSNVTRSASDEAAAIVCHRVLQPACSFVHDTINIDFYRRRRMAVVIQILKQIRPHCCLKLLPLLNPDYPNHKRKLIAVDLVRNCSFDHQDYADVLLTSDTLLVALLLPLIGGEEFDDTEMDRLPVDLQYMPSDKAREPDAGVRTKLLETLYQLCSNSRGRQHLRDRGAYYVLREYHTWQRNNGQNQDEDDAVILVENIVGLLIQTEEEIGIDDIKRSEQTNAVG